MEGHSGVAHKEQELAGMGEAAVAAGVEVGRLVARSLDDSFAVVVALVEEPVASVVVAVHIDAGEEHAVAGHVGQL